jgi:hypothetical protein
MRISQADKTLDALTSLANAEKWLQYNSSVCARTDADNQGFQDAIHILGLNQDILRDNLARQMARLASKHKLVPILATC